MNVILFDEPSRWQSLLPVTYTRPISDIRLGIFTIREKWAWHLKTEPSYHTMAYLSTRYPEIISEDSYYINGALLPNAYLIDQIVKLDVGQALVGEEKQLLAYRGHVLNLDEEFKHVDQVSAEQIKMIRYPWDLFSGVSEEIAMDISLIKQRRISKEITDEHTIVYGPENIFIEEGAEVKAAIINAESGPVYLGKDSKVHEGAIIKGPFALGEGAHINMGAKMRGDSSIGPYCKVGGEVSNSVFLGYSNKGHDGFLGNAVIGEWCNLGADTNSSNLKNNYSNVRVWNYAHKTYIDTGRQFCGVIMGDHSKCGINTMLNTGTVVGVSSNIFGAEFPDKFIPSFSWGGGDNFTEFHFSKAIEISKKVMERRQKELSDNDIDILKEIFNQSKIYRQ